jgi:hypothetical protein
MLAAVMARKYASFEPVIARVNEQPPNLRKHDVRNVLLVFCGLVSCASEMFYSGVKAPQSKAHS